MHFTLMVFQGSREDWVMMWTGEGLPLNFGS